MPLINDLFNHFTDSLTGIKRRHLFFKFCILSGSDNSSWIIFKYYILAIIITFHKVSLFFKETKHLLCKKKNVFHFKSSIHVINLNLLYLRMPEAHILFLLLYGQKSWRNKGNWFTPGHIRNQNHFPQILYEHFNNTELLKNLSFKVFLILL